MEQHEDNYLQNRLAESLQISGGAGENHLLHTLADPAGGDLSAAPKSERDGDGDEDEEWKYIHEVQQTEKLQQQEQHPSDTGNGFGQDDLIHGNGLGNGLAAAAVAAAAGLNLVYEEEDVEVIKHDGDLSTNSNTTTSTGEVLQHQEEEEEEQQQQPQQIELAPEQQQQLQQEDEDEASSVATTYGTSSLSENNQEEAEQELAPQPTASAQELLFEAFDDKENAEPAESHEESHSQLNPNAVAFVPSFGSQPSSPLPNNAGEEAMLGLNPRQLLAPLDDLVAESPRKGSARENMDAIAVPDEMEFDIEADKRPHELEQESDIFGAGNLEQQLLNGAGNGGPVDTLDHGPETCVDLDVSLDQLPADEDVMKQSIYADHNASIEDILNSVQPLPEQIGDEKELLHVEEKEHVSQSPSTEELQFQQEFQQVRHQPPFFGGAGEDPMQASFYLEHTSLEAQKEQEQELEEPLHQQPADTSDPFAEQSLLLDTSAPMFSPEAQEPVAKLELESQQADIVDITPSPLSSTEEKHLVEDTKELLEDEPKSVEIEAEFVKEQDLELESRQEPAMEHQLEPDTTHPFEPLSVGAPSQLEEYAAFNAAPGYEAQHDEDTVPAVEQGINPFAQPFTPAANLVLDEPTAAHFEPETQLAAGNGFNELQLQEELVEEEQYTAKPDFDAQFLDLGDKVQLQTTEDQPQEQATLNDDFIVPQQEQQFSAPEEQVLPPLGDFVAQDQQFVAPEEQLLPVAKEFVEQTTAAAAVVAAAAAEEEPVVFQTEEAVLPTSEPVLVDDLPESEKYEEQAAVPVAEVAAVATAAAAAVTVAAVAAATKSKDSKPSPPEAKKPATKAGPAASKPKPAGTAASSAIKKTTSSSTTTAKTTTARPRTAPVATTKPASAAPPTAATRKPLSSSAGTAAKPLASRTALSSTTTRPATAPVSKPAAAASKTTVSKPTASAARTTAAPRPASSTTARKPATNGTASGTASGTAARKATTSAPSSTRSTLSSSAPAPKPRLPASSTTATAAASTKPKVPSPRAASTSTTVRKVASTNGTSLSARSPTKPTTNGLGSKTSSSTTTTTTTTTITKTFTARPAPKFNHSTATNGSSTTRRPLGTTTSSTLTVTTASASLRKSSPLKASPLKAATTKPLTPKAKESATAAKPSPAGLKARKSTPLKGSTPTPIKAPVAAAPPAEPAAATNGEAKEEEVIKQNGNGVHEVEEAQEIQEQPPIQDQVPAGAAEVSLLDF
ncbi:hypothetical protein KR032_003887 [Drosophila birchii]|nr:hypothetical protein KR032_003887 [Drosophila birchii]